MKKRVLFMLSVFFLLAACAPKNPIPATPESLSPEMQQENTLVPMTETEAKSLAEAACIKGGEALGPGIYNSDLGTWSFEANLNATRPGCTAACVVEEMNKIATLQWNCTKN